MVKSAPAGISGSASFNLCANCPSSRLVCGYSGTHLQPADAAKLPPVQALIAPASAASTLLPLVFSLFVVPDKPTPVNALFCGPSAGLFKLHFSN